MQATGIQVDGPVVRRATVRQNQDLLVLDLQTIPLSETEPVAKLHDGKKSMILRHLAMDCKACPNSADGGLPNRASE
jgi:hypothetical protein